MTLAQLVQRVAVDRPRLLAALHEWVRRNEQDLVKPAPTAAEPVRWCHAHEGHHWDPTGQCGRCPAIRCNALIRQNTASPAHCALARETCRYHPHEAR